ncbi:hypothetical protein IK112_03370 [Candidatus Saccharibacteria bacterium]|nr:hypothetical protein [Candidatus Saccharibacteria bacterium]
MANKKTKHSGIIIDLIKNKASVSDALYQLKLLISDLNDNSIINWINSELEGYKDSDDIPPYRSLRSPLYGEIQYISLGNLINRKMQIPVKTEHLNFLEIKIKDNISVIEKWAKEDSSDKKMPFDLRIASSIADMNLSEMCQIMGAWLPIASASFSEITNSVKNKILDILMELENKYGNLDDYTIDFKDKKDKDATSKTIINIIYNDNSVKVGDKNKIDGSILGDNNEH